MICSYICYLLFLKISAILLFARAIYLVHLFCIHLAFETVFCLFCFSFLIILMHTCLFLVFSHSLPILKHITLFCFVFSYILLRSSNMLPLHVYASFFSLFAFLFILFKKIHTFNIFNINSVSAFC